jgi:NADH-quinone oxidoreductase subunit H
MTLVTVILFAAKALFVVLFAMNLAVLLTWADRRQGAMIQDRVGPNRAVAWIPTRAAQALAVLPALAVAAGIIGYFVKFEAAPADRSGRAMLFCQLAILFTWFTGLVIAGRVKSRGPRNSFELWIDSIGPRRLFALGLSAHVGTVLLALVFRGTELGRTLREFAYGAGPALLAFVILFGAVYSAYAIRNEPRIGLRLAGLLHPAADGLKTLWKEDFIPPNADRFLHSIAPLIAFFPALVVLAVVPFGDTLCFGTRDGALAITELLSRVPKEGVCVEGAVKLQVVDLNVGLLYFFALAGTGIVGAALAGWASDNKFSLLGGLRAASQMISYEVTMGLTLIGALMIYGTLRVDEMIRWQAEHSWGIFVQPLAFFLFFAAAVAESKRIPFDIPEGESEIVAGYYTEYAGMKFAMFFFAEYIAVVTSSAILAAVFLGGWHLPFVFRDGIHVEIGGQTLFQQALPHGLVVLIGVLAFIFKTIALCWVQLTVRWTLPRFRYDQLMRLGWRVMLPISLVNILVTGLVMLALDAGGAQVQSALSLLGDLSMAAIALAGAFAFVYFILFLAKPVHKRRTLASTSAQYAAELGGTPRAARMGA